MQSPMADAPPDGAPAARDFDAATYHRISAPHQAWAAELLDRLALRGDETVLDAGCGTGRVTELLLARLPRGRVVAVDSAPSMVARAREVLGARATVIEADLTRLELPTPVDAVFSNAVFHWIADHDALFARLFAALRPGGRLVAQCGGAGNIARFLAVADAVAARPPYAPHLAGWRAPKRFAAPEETVARLRRAGFADARAWLVPWEVTPSAPADFVRTLCLKLHLEQLPEALRDRYLADVLAAAGTPVRLDFVRLNIDARRPT
mgnify:CR=1 FL=1